VAPTRPCRIQGRQPPAPSRPRCALARDRPGVGRVIRPGDHLPQP
jgi:hypothetical protein